MRMCVSVLRIKKTKSEHKPCPLVSFQTISESVGLHIHHTNKGSPRNGSYLTVLSFCLDSRSVLLIS